MGKNIAQQKWSSDARTSKKLSVELMKIEQILTKRERIGSNLFRRTMNNAYFANGTNITIPLSVSASTTFIRLTTDF